MEDEPLCFTFPPREALGVVWGGRLRHGALPDYYAFNFWYLSHPVGFSSAAAL